MIDPRTIADRARDDVNERQMRNPGGTFADEATRLSQTGTDLAFEKALKKKDIAFICETKRASPSRGVISADYPYADIAMEYEKGGAAAVSVLTEPHYFKGDVKHLKDISAAVSIPVLRKDFITCHAHIYESKVLGADAVLLICSLMEEQKLQELISLTRSLRMSALVETRNEKEIKKAVNAGAGIIGVNNRDLNTFEVNISTSERLRKFVPRDVIFVAESGIGTPEDVERMRTIGADAVLIGEALMTSADKCSMLAHLRGR